MPKHSSSGDHRGVAWLKAQPGHGLSSAIATAGEDDAVRVLVVCGPWSADSVPASSIAAISKPVVAWVNGACFDQGLELALACDIRVAAPGARFAMRQVRSGRLPEDGGTQRLPRAVGRAHALRLLLTGEEIGAEEALRIGLVQQIGDAKAVEELVESMAAGAPIAAAYAKEAVISGADLSLDQGARLEADLSFLLQSTKDRAEGLRAFKAKKGEQPKFEGR
ncbi:MAG: enoyl-CoA hydratase/isomerase family protein [Dehalococcoidia bacterium]